MAAGIMQSSVPHSTLTGMESAARPSRGITPWWPSRVMRAAMSAKGLGLALHRAHPVQNRKSASGNATPPAEHHFEAGEKVFAITRRPVAAQDQPEIDFRSETARRDQRQRGDRAPPRGDRHERGRRPAHRMADEMRLADAARIEFGETALANLPALVASG